LKTRETTAEKSAARRTSRCHPSPGPHRRQRDQQPCRTPGRRLLEFPPPRVARCASERRWGDLVRALRLLVARRRRRRRWCWRVPASC